MSADGFSDLVRPFAEAIAALSGARLNGSLGLTNFQDARFREAISTMIRKASDVVYPAVLVPEVSVAANAAAAELGIDLRQETWHSQKKFDPGYKVFHYEHMRPVGAILTMASEADSVDTIVNVLRTELKVAWITKEEDKALRALGFAAKRPDPDAAYEAAGIYLLSETTAESHLRPTGDGEPEAQWPIQGQRTTAPTAPPAPDPLLLPPTVRTSEPPVTGGPHEPGFMPVSPGDAFHVAQLGLCLGGLVQLYTEDGLSVWSVGNDRTLFETQCRAFLARTARSEHAFREVGLLNAATGTLLLQPRFPESSVSSDSGEALSFQASTVQLAPPGEPDESWEADLQTLLTRAAQHTLGGGGQLRVETGGWDAPLTPFCSVEMAFANDMTPLLYLEASPAPTDSRWWKDRMQPVDEMTVRLVLPASDFKPDRVALLLRDAMAWDGVSPWELALTYTSPPQSVVKT
jgi:hypothetical protein